MKTMHLILLAASLALAACDKPAGTGAKEDESNAANSPAPAGDRVLFTGTFEGRNDHVVTGRVQIVQAGGKYSVVLGDDFSLDAAPAPRVGLGIDGYKKDTQSGRLKAIRGASSYVLREGIDPAGYNEVYIWCETFNVVLGVAALSPAESK